MTTTESILLIAALLLALLVIGNIGFSKMAERRNPPIGKFLECDGVALHYIDRGNREAPCVVLLLGNGSMIQDFTISGLVDLLARSNRVVCFDRLGFVDLVSYTVAPLISLAILPGALVRFLHPTLSRRRSSPDGRRRTVRQPAERSKVPRQAGSRSTADIVDLTDFSDTAPLISALDLVIAVDTSVAHLAAALGRPTWILLPYVPDYRWLLGRDPGTRRFACSGRQRAVTTTA